MIHLSDLPLVNASLNSIALILLLTGYQMIRSRRIVAHKRCMIAAFGLSVAFLISYLTYRFAGQEKKFGGQGWIRPVYFFILITHVTLAMTVPVLATWTLVLGLRQKWEKHRRMAKLTLPIWLYVSITGVVVYVLLFRVYGPAATGL